MRTLGAALFLTMAGVGFDGSVQAGERETQIMLGCAGTTGGEAVSFASCVGSALVAQEIDNLFTGKFMECNNEIRKLFRAFDGGCRTSSHAPPKLKFAIAYRSGFILGYKSGGDSLYYSPDGQNLRGGGRTKRVYAGGQTVRAIVPFNGGVVTAFSQGGIYYSTDGYDLGAGHNRVYSGYPVHSTRVKNGKLRTCFVIGGKIPCYCASNPRFPGGGQGTSRC